MRTLYTFLIVTAALWVMPRNAHGQLYVSPEFHAPGFVGKYDAKTGVAINANFIMGLNFPVGLAVKKRKIAHQQSRKIIYLNRSFAALAKLSEVRPAHHNAVIAGNARERREQKRPPETRRNRIRDCSKYPIFRAFVALL